MGQLYGGLLRFGSVPQICFPVRVRYRPSTIGADCDNRHAACPVGSFAQRDRLRRDFLEIPLFNRFGLRLGSAGCCTLAGGENGFIVSAESGPHVRHMNGQHHRV